MTMAAGMYGLTIEKFLNLGLTSFTSGLESETLVKTMLVQDAYTPNFDTHDFRNDVTNEPANSGTYVSGGVVITTTELTVAAPAATQIAYTAANPAGWTGSTITARGAITYKNTGTAATDELVVANSFGSDVSTAGGTFTLQWNASGLFYIDYA